MASLVSVIVPTYNRERFLAEAIHSALCQSWIDLEVIVVDDGSRDHSFEILQELARHDARLRIFRQENSGVSAARNRALAAARGDYIAFLDSDDVWFPWKLNLQLHLLQQRPDVGMVWTDMDAIRPDGTSLQRGFLRHMYSAYQRVSADELFTETFDMGQLGDADPEHGHVRVSVGNIYPKMFFGNLVHTPTVVLRRSWADQVGPFDTSMRRGGEDFKYHLATCRLGPVGFIDVATILYRVGNGDQVTNRENSVHFANSYLRTLTDELREHRKLLPLGRGEINQLFSHAHDWLAYELVQSGPSLRGMRHAALAIYQRGSLGKSWRTLIKGMLPRMVTKLMSRATPGKPTQTQQPENTSEVPVTQASLSTPVVNAKRVSNSSAEISVVNGSQSEKVSATSLSADGSVRFETTQIDRPTPRQPITR
ncbi:MAG: glycosyltransferase family 2 protein [Planctomycetaceae bacterium]|nr:glycosyltransferase family 2 protein [Planctomycetaceae bacterium]